MRSMATCCSKVSMLGWARTRSSRLVCTAWPVASAACTTRRLEWPPSRDRCRPPGTWGSGVKATPLAVSQAIISRAWLATSRVTASSQRPAPATRVSWTCASIESPLSTAAAIPPCAQSLAPSVIWRLVTMATRRWSASLSAVVSAARPLPRTRTSCLCILCMMVRAMIAGLGPGQITLLGGVNFFAAVCSHLPEDAVTYTSSINKKQQGEMSDRELDQVLVERAQQGDKRAFELLVSKYHRKLVRLLSRMVRDSAEVEDITQEAFIKAYRALPGFRGESAFYTWLYRIAVNTAKNYLVAHKRQPVSSDVLAEDAENYDDGGLLRDIATPDAELQTKQIAKAVNEAVDALPDELRTAITLREIEGMSYDEIAQMMECPIGTVRSRIFRAREAIAEKIRPMLGTSQDKRW